MHYFNASTLLFVQVHGELKTKTDKTKKHDKNERELAVLDDKHNKEFSHLDCIPIWDEGKKMFRNSKIFFFG